mgnify:CR=1 FL=1
MQKLGKAAFVLAPICLFASFFSSAVFQNKTLMSVFIVAATLFLILAVIGKVMDSRNGSDGEDGGRS